VKRGAHWPFVLAGLLAAGVAANVYLLVRASTDPSFSVEPDYYAKAVAWDAHAEQLRKDADLGWKADLSTGAEGVVVRLSDRDGRPVAGARVDIEAFALARGNQVVRGSLIEAADHAYRAELPVRRPGLWEFRLTAVRDADTFTAVVQQDVGGSRP
jgi:nitrogen fixation protein FixH